MIEKDLKRYAKYFKGYTELRYQENRISRISFLNGALVMNEENSLSGFSARSYKNGFWGFASSPVTGEGEVSRLLCEAVHNASFMASKSESAVGAFPKARIQIKSNLSTKLTRRSRKEIIEFVREVDAHIAAKYKKVKSRRMLFDSLDMEKQFLNSDGSDVYSFLPRSNGMVNLSVEAGGRNKDFFETWGGGGQFEDVFHEPSDLFQKLDQQYEHLLRKAEGVFPEGGKKECVLAPELAGVLAHEAIGHTTEADYVLSGSIAEKLLGKKVASPMVTIVDFANMAMGKTCQTPVYADDEGTKAEDVVLIDKGVLRSYMHNKETALRFGVSPAGNARAFSFSDEPMIRMRNTAIVPGHDKLDEMIASVKNGYYLMRRSNGQADLTSEFMFGVTLGYEIKNGKLGRAIRDTTVSGVAYDVLKTVSMVSDDMYWRTFGFCTKSQPMLLSMGGPAIKCQVNIGGR